MKRRCFIGLMLASSLAQASIQKRMSLEEMASQADHLLVGTIYDVDIVDEKGKPINDKRFMTGPFLRNTIRLHVRVERLIATSARSVPDTLLIPLNDFMHYSVGQVRDVELGNPQPFLLLLKGDRFAPIAPGIYRATLSDEKKALGIYEQRSGSR